MPKGTSGGPLIFRVALTKEAAEVVRGFINKPRYTKKDVNALVSRILVQMAKQEEANSKKCGIEEKSYESTYRIHDLPWKRNI